MTQTFSPHGHSTSPVQADAVSFKTKTNPSTEFEPYIPPNETDGLVTVDTDLCWRLHPEGLVTPAAIAAICWARNHFKIPDTHHRALLDGLGLEYFNTGIGSTVLRPKDAYRLQHASTVNPADPGKQHKLQTFSLASPVLALEEYDAIEVYPCISANHGIERFEANEHALTVSPDFWSVALHLETGGIETIADFPQASQAESFGELMRQILLEAREAEGLSSPHLQPLPTT
ncbi:MULTISPECIES: hypothetical protein [Polaromonas]|uniref:Uncharacterized protein n=1 Tax=Polaromonas aquatica TaxID=332657 RepID=A0ABW1TU48_9BURK